MSLSHRSLAGALCALILLLPHGLAADTSAETLDRIVAVVNDGIILESELETELVRVRQRLEAEDRDIPEADVLRERVLDELVLEEVQLQQAEQNNIRVDDREVNEALRDMAAENGTDLAGLRDHFRAEGMDFDRLRSNVRKQITVQRLQERAVASKVQISSEDVDDFLTRADQSEDEDREFRLRHILIGVPSDASNDEVDRARERAEETATEAREGTDFGDLANRRSDGPRALEGGDLGWRSREQLPTLFADELAGVQSGNIVGPIRSPNGFHILELVDVRGGTSERITQMRARQILITEDDEDADGPPPRERLADLRRRIQAGASFEELARTHSDHDSATRGGDLGWVGPADHSPPMQEAMAELSEDEISEPFQTPEGWHIVQVLERRQRADADQQRRSRARQALYEREVEEERQRWLRELRDSAYVELRLDG